jgi:hypothetical protein
VFDFTASAKRNQPSTFDNLLKIKGKLPAGVETEVAANSLSLRSCLSL